MDRHGLIFARLRRSNVCVPVKWSFVLSMSLMLTVCSGPAASILWAAAPAKPDSGSLLAKLEKRGDLTLKQTSITDAIYTISETWQINIVVQADIEGEINGVFKQAPLKEILDSLLLINGYSYRPVGESLVIMPLSDVGDVSPLFKTVIIPLRYGVPEEILPVVEILKSPRGRVQSIASSRSLMVVDFPHHVEMIQRHAIELDQAAGRQQGTLTATPDDVGESNVTGRIKVGYFAPQYVRAIQLEKVVADLLSAEGKASIVEKENRIVVADYPDRIQLVADAVKHLDVPRQQVRIIAYIYDISLEDIEEIGINWNSALKGNNLDVNGDPQDVFAIDSITQVPPVLGAANGIMTFMSLSRNFDITAVVNALQQSDDSRLLADPNVTVLDNDQASIEIVTEIPYQELTETSGGGSIGTTSFREAGVKLHVSPRIAADGTIELDVTPSFSRLAGFTPADNQPIIDRREANTTIRVADHQTIVIGGLRQRTDVGDFTGIPILKDIPIAGKLFRNRNTTVRESELVVFLTPIIVPFDGHPHGRYEAAMETTDCWLHRVPWAEGCPPPGHPDCPEHCYDEGELPYPAETVHGEAYSPIPHDSAPEENARRLPHVEDEGPLLPPQPSAQSSRRIPPASPVRETHSKLARNETRAVSSPTPRRNTLREPQRPEAQGEASTENKVPVRAQQVVPRVKLADKPVVLPHDARPGRGDIPRRLPPVVALTKYEAPAGPAVAPPIASPAQSTKPSLPSSHPDAARRRRVSGSLRQPYGTRYQSAPVSNETAATAGQIPSVARTPSVSPHAFKAKSSAGKPTLPAVFDAFKP